MVGKPLAWDVYDDKNVLLLHTGNIIESPNQIDILLARGIFHISGELPGEPDMGKPRRQEETSPFQLIDQIYSRLERILSLSVPETEKEFPEKITSLCRMLQQSCAQDGDATLSTLVLAPAGRYSIKHPLDVAVICELIGRALGMPDEERTSVLAAALTENIGMTLLSDVLYSQAAPLTDKQRKEIQDHPQQGVEILRSFGVHDPVWTNAVLMHHESSDGKGYPGGLREPDIPPYAHLIAASDFYCAKISGRSYRPPLSSHKAMQFVFPAGESRIDARIAELFVKTLGIFLPGTFVVLKNNQTAVVTHRGERIQSPGVHAVTGKDGMPLLGPMFRDTSNPDYAIVRIIPPHKVAVKVNRYQLWGYGEFKNKKVIF